MASTEQKPLDKSPSQLHTVDDLCKKLEALKRHRMPLERQWRLNLAFYKGKQYSYYAPRSDRLESLATEDGVKPRHRVRIVCRGGAPRPRAPFRPGRVRAIPPAVQRSRGALHGRGARGLLALRVSGRRGAGGETGTRAWH